MRICIVGCGAVGSLFAANLATLDDVEVWAFDLYQAHVDAIERDGLRLSGAGEVHARLRATSDAARAAALRLRDRRDQGDARRVGDRGDCARVRGRSRRVGDERRRERGDAGPPCRPCDSRDDVPRRQAARAGPCAVGREGRHDVLAVRAGARLDGAGRRTRGRLHARRDAGHAVADARPAQWRKVIFNASTNPIGALTGPHATDACASVPISARSSAASSTRARPWLRRRGSRSMRIRRS